MRIQLHIEIEDSELVYDNSVLRTIMKYCNSWGDQFNNDMGTDGVMYVCNITDDNGNVLYD